ncbi:regulator of sigma E protease [Sagittula marina]|uniref:Zinc metalloprotease n=1 Tax=Sagittula marina TaxID=943940 RepID=A0A7W6GRL6_9RHOB|nr:RIP metalloprotease RseP [Sagittula marina]MBB3985040.1 regulator of sigma E protease [Sagittula marina]
MDLTTLSSSFGGVLWTAVFFVIALSVIIAIHEYGHYIVGKKSGIFPEVFSLGFGPVIYSRVDGDGTKWQLAAIPFGGYVKFRGDGNASGAIAEEGVMDSLSEDDKRSTMIGAPLWARAATVAAGPVFNFVLSIVIFTAVFLYRGVAADPLIIDELKPTPYTQNLRNGDQVLAIEGNPIPSQENGVAYSEFVSGLPEQPLLDYTVLRDGTELTVEGPYLRAPIVGSVVPRSAAMDAGLQVGDVITKLEGQEVFSFMQLPAVIEASEGAPVDLEIWRDGEVLNKTLEARRMDEPLPEGGFRTVYRIGLGSGQIFEPETVTPSFLDALWGSVRQVWTIMSGSVSGLWHMATGAISTCNLSGPIGIAETAGDMASQGTVSFIWLIAVLSTAIGMLNLFPIPVLDGGHLVFYAYEAVFGKPPSDGALKVLMSVGLTLVLAMMLFGLTNDLIFCP